MIKLLKKIFGKKDDGWIFVSEYPVKEYKCGLKAGDKVRLKQDLIIEDHEGVPTGKIYPKGEIWHVLPGSKEPTIVVWFRQADGECHTWDDDRSIYEWFEKVEQ